MSKFTAQYFYEKFSAIPEYQWAAGDFNMGYGIKCANGHCGVDTLYLGSLNNITVIPTWEAFQLKKVFSVLPLNGFDEIDEDEFNYFFSSKVVLINDNETEEYQQCSPKQRILAALSDIIAMEKLQHESQELINVREQRSPIQARKQVLADTQ